MGILSGPAIREAFNNGDIVINPWIPEHVGPNSYDLRLDKTLLVHDTHELVGDRIHPLDVHEQPPTKTFDIPEEGCVLEPDVLYLGSTIEYAGSDKYVPCIEGRSSMARLGISPHVSAGFGDHGFKGRWTLEITVAHPVRVYPEMRICQVYFHELTGDPMPYDKRPESKYVNSDGVRASMSFLDGYVRVDPDDA